MTIHKLLPLLRCPISRTPLSLKDNTLFAENGICSYPVKNGVPIFIEKPESVRIHSVDHISNGLSVKALEFIKSTDGLVLNLSAGGSDFKCENIVELEYSIFRNTDIVADAHFLPFRDGMFAGCICMNAFEHYRNPQDVMSEIHRILKPEGRLFLHTAGLQPLHEAPFHFYNVTRYGLKEWLKDFEILDLSVSANFNPVYGISWIASELEKGVAQSQPDLLKEFQKITLNDLAEFWRDPNLRNNEIFKPFFALDQSTQECCASGWQAIVRKPQ